MCQCYDRLKVRDGGSCTTLEACADACHKAFNEFVHEREATKGTDPSIMLFDQIILAKKNRGRTSIFSKSSRSSCEQSQICLTNHYFQSLDFSKTRRITFGAQLLLYHRAVASLGTTGKSLAEVHPPGSPMS